MATKSKTKKAKGKDSEVLEIKPIDKPAEEDKKEEVKEDEPKEDTPKKDEPKEDESVKEPEESEQPSSDLSETPEVGVVDTTEDIASVEEDEPKDKKGSKKGLVLSLLATLAVGGALTGGILYSRTSLDTRSKAATPKATSTPVPEATSTPEANPTVEVLDLTEYSVNILNGSGVAGQAGAVNDLLEEAGFEGMDTGNADSYDYETTEVSLAESTPEAVFDAIKKALEDDYEVTESDAIDEDSDYDILIIVGQN